MIESNTSSPHFLMVTLEANSGIGRNTIQKALNAAVDWVMYMPNCYILYSDRSVQDWYEEFKPILGARDHVFICAVDLNERQGWLSSSVWDWIRKYDYSPEESPALNEKELVSV